MSETVYKSLDPCLERLIADNIKRGVLSEYRGLDDNAARRSAAVRDRGTVLRPPYIRDVDKIMHLPLYNRYSDKTQVFSFYKNDDITRRSLHVQLVSRIARTIGRMLGLNLDLIEAIALGHDLGHTPFGHTGEDYLSQLYHNQTGLYFNHNVHSVRVLDQVYKRNLTLQTLDGILCHNGEFEQIEYRPRQCGGFNRLDQDVASCYSLGKSGTQSLVPSTLEGCLVRICDIIAYIGKDRQDAEKANIVVDHYTDGALGTYNAPIINNLMVSIIENSYGKDYIGMDNSCYTHLQQSKAENYKLIYKNKSITEKYTSIIYPMFEEVYLVLLNDLKRGNSNSLIFKHHINQVERCIAPYGHFIDEYKKTPPDLIVVDYIASMTDDYFIELHGVLFPNSTNIIQYKPYF